ncbi:DUF559 domain-containing protein [Miniimonas arenae]|uniref:DUF559 domain-containing protein n=2 Tax=Miniimonas arenae TaxID=676201 RepID=A0A5C5B9F9_9MICO|nr:DUF559 domain-containing protein [Miniimonas arenae]
MLLMSIFETMRRLNGVATLRELGAHRRSVNRVVATGALNRVGHGRYALPSAAHEFVRAVQVDGVVDCLSALRSYGFTVRGDGTVAHVTVPSHRGMRGRRPPGVRLHYGPIRRHLGVRVAPPEDALVRAMSCLPYLDALSALELARLVPGAPGVDVVLAGVRASNRSLADDLERDLDVASRAYEETTARLALVAAGHGVIAGCLIPGVGEVDLLVDGRIIVEIDGFAYHRDRRPYRTDRRRDRRAAHLGFAVLRFAWEDADPQAICAEVADLLEVDPRPRPFSRRIGDAERHEVGLLRAECLARRGTQVSERAARALEQVSQLTPHVRPAGVAGD